ncbi:hypothetical protein KSF_055850 [Reticulibacter mediterranei]|uniref:Aldolase n=1 Tax=Reticulibacter mediterranei TaxID=2778369 RepID=A0A8J3N5V5_9CHLR|nr:hypothetical protein [Reticulibacter mediterranei]GHO95537.1 hypothetical protein KSF_055850 [Reticulibacter mediterranei]
MAKLQDLFSQARRTQSSGGMGFLGKSKPESKPHAASLVVEFPTVAAGSAEAAIKAGADGLLFAWNGKETAQLETIKQEIASARALNEDLVTGLRLTGGWEKLTHDSLLQIKEQGIQYIILPLNAPAHLLAIETKEVEKVVTVPLQAATQDNLSRFFVPLAIRSLAALSGIGAVLVDFGFKASPGTLTIEDAAYYRGLREVAQYPAFVPIQAEFNEQDAHALKILGVQAVILTASESGDTTTQQLKQVRELLEKLFQEEKDSNVPGIRR